MTISGNSDCASTHICEMMQRLGIDPGAGAAPRLSLTYMAAHHRCKSCTAKSECAEWLAGAPTLAPGAPDFCPCKDILFELQIGQPRRASVSPSAA